MIRMLVVAVALVGCESETTQKAHPASDGVEPYEKPKPAVDPPEEPPPPPEPKITDLDLSAALSKLKPTITDSVNAYSEGQAQLVLWATKKLKWSDIDVKKNETTQARVKKDSEPEIGKRMCVKGRVAQIVKEKAGDEKVFTGLLLRRYKPTSFIAVGSTGDLVERSRARFCGLVAGNYAFSNVSGGQTQTVLLIGMFDLPENRATSAEAKH